MSKSKAAASAPYRKVMNYPLIQTCDMSEEMKTDTMDLCVTSYEKHSTDHEKVSRLFHCYYNQENGQSFLTPFLSRQKLCSLD
ncbi:dynein axonemal light chain 4 isoform X2 [Parasteatoda tepidariorum]|uniref:dynein axonemal light chain 4 isoform X2 n=1 Tax=Parasteatoda tepidariorum TaxID=114398 RepID=UPI00077FB69E|nr:uncharacterized protein LOC107447384 isoform X2 [Parasteatoda tepidariorum]